MNAPDRQSSLRADAKPAGYDAGRRRGFKLEIVETDAELEAMKPGWRALEMRDPESGVFLSWDWLSRAFRDNPQRWRVFAVRSGRDYVCIFPAKYRVHWSRKLIELQSEIEAGGRLIWSEYTGFLCDPEHEEAALEFLARHLAALPWSRLSLRYEASESRAERFMRAFPPDQFNSKSMEYRINKGETDNLVSPQIALPATFEDYLQTKLSKNAREKVRRSFRRHVETGELRISQTTTETFDRDVDILLKHWTRKWAPTKGIGSANKVAGNYRRILRSALDLGGLFLPVLWKDEIPLGALGHVIDVRNRQVHFIVAGRNTAADISNIGIILHTHSIRWAIRNGFRIYDFCHGNEAYKYSFGAEDKRLNYFSIRRRSSGSGAGTLDVINTGEALRRAIEFIDAGKQTEASAACRQILFDCI